MPFYYQATFERIPNTIFDIVLYNQKSPIVLTIKTSLRERYKQAELEGLVLKQVYRRSKTYLITLSEEESQKIKNKIEQGGITGIDNCLLANKEEFDRLLQKIKKEDFIKAEKILPINNGKFIS